MSANKKIAEALGWTHFKQEVGFEELVWCAVNPTSKAAGRQYIPDFFNSEDASAMLLEVMPPMLIAKCKLRAADEPIQWDVQIGSHHELHDDRKTAIAKAFMAWKGI